MWRSPALSLGDPAGNELKCTIINALKLPIDIHRVRQWMRDALRARKIALPLFLFAFDILVNSINPPRIKRCSRW